MNWLARHACSVAASLLLIGIGRPALHAQSAPAATTTVILVRHAEKADAPRADPPLTAAGEARAKALLQAVHDAGVTAIITTQFARTRETAAPAATALGISPEIITATGPAHAQDVAAAVRKHAGETVLVVGHSNTIPEIIHALGAEAPTICDAEYDNLFVLVLPPEGAPRLIRAKFGARSTVAECASMK